MVAHPAKDILPFKPGDKSRFYIPDIGAPNIPKIEELIGKTVIVRHPSRIHATLLDLLQLKPATASGGGIALSIGDYATVCEAKLFSEERLVFEKEYYAEADHLARVFCEAIGYKGGISLNIHTDLQPHQGQGSSSALMASTVVALNELFNNPFSQYSLRKLIGENYVELSKTNADELCFGATTGVGAAAGFYGGICAISSNYEILEIAQPPENYAIMTFSPKLSSPKKDHPTRKEGEVAEDNISFREQEIKLEQSYSEKRCKVVLMDFIPAMRKNDFKEMGKAMQTLNKYFLFPHIFNTVYPDSVQELSDKLKLLESFEDVDITGMSSLGPTMYATGYKQDLEKVALELSVRNQILHSSVKISPFSKGLHIWKDGIESKLKYQKFSEQ
jgi:predicted sugar kinase